VTPDVETAYAKLNLALHVRRREPDGYHAIETIFAFAQDGDRLTLRTAPGLTVAGPFAAALSTDEDNLVLRAARGFAVLTGCGGGAGFHLEKNLPVAAGIGGGSADAAAALRLLCRAHGIPVDDPKMMALAGTLGADVPACLLSRPVRGRGRGDVLEPVRGLEEGRPVLLLNPRLPLATGPVFHAWDGKDRGELEDEDPLTAALRGRNDLEEPAIRLMPIIADMLALLRAQDGAVLARMSGSGATCFAMFASDARRDAAAAAIAAAQPGWWLLATALR
jgi:4-diphosphocytidyl-2-C-methyl-D-erythritol kinase